MDRILLSRFWPRKQSATLLQQPHLESTYVILDVQALKRQRFGISSIMIPVSAPKKQQSRLDMACPTRRDSSGVVNICKTWYIFFVHSACCVGFMVALNTLVDSSSSAQRSWKLKQADVTGIVSTTLVTIRTLAGVGSTPYSFGASSLFSYRKARSLLQSCAVSPVIGSHFYLASDQRGT
jgi:hypothetical protein